MTSHTYTGRVALHISLAIPRIQASNIFTWWAWNQTSIFSIVLEFIWLKKQFWCKIWRTLGFVVSKKVKASPLSITTVIKEWKYKYLSILYSVQKTNEQTSEQNSYKHLKIKCFTFYQISPDIGDPFDSFSLHSNSLSRQSCRFHSSLVPTN